MNFCSYSFRVWGFGSPGGTEKDDIWEVGNKTEIKRKKKTETSGTTCLFFLNVFRWDVFAWGQFSRLGVLFPHEAALAVVFEAEEFVCRSFMDTMWILDGTLHHRLELLRAVFTPVSFFGCLVVAAATKQAVDCTAVLAAIRFSCHRVCWT